ncbi:Riboflavin transporter rft-1 [Caenorhabditis elegans]|uniref:Riboflavin transporter rft-1 n=1 Tax=Caenorhabditis elegans TaxID=6239 RepID=S52AA_CAEEL|nr:Riboflavin transporter rft-1 [Caenorhabditis elegans]Q3LFN0.2 RecName: Full=Riboflavin transporter rft-1; AltName: Full=Solute carrier family 52, riboflavin transporter rft-1 [Caenorhabditis elegans]CCD69385.2 Riboflavin transporter rft-1 [Caenorhabditis elegans]|eukprot:NP_001033515.2 Riboflavin transporter rft-1 [Caenorhabditis elegans]
MKTFLFTFCLVAIFGSSSWIGTNSVWMELSLLTAKLPEGWNLPSYLSAIVQIACLGPLIYSIIHKGIKMTIPTVPLIFIFMVLACICQLGLCFFWDDTGYIFGAIRSWPLYLLLFGLAIVDAISSVLFLPFMAQFHPSFLNAYFVGMGLSALIPSLLSLIQGTSNYWCDDNKTPHYYPPRFSVSMFFLINFFFTCAAVAAFLVLYKIGAHKNSSQVEPEPKHSIQIIQGDSTTDVNEVNTESSFQETSSIPDSSSATGARLAFLLLTTALVNAQMNGIVTSVQSYATLVYSQNTYHYAVTLSNVISPLASYLQFFVKIRSLPILAFLTLCSSLTTAVIIYLAALSPNWIFNSETAGTIISIASSLIAAGLHSYLRVMFAALLREGNQKESRLFWCGAFIQIGSFTGSAIMFPLVNVWKLFHSAPSCR